jgi:rhamnosyltransferase
MVAILLSTYNGEKYLAEQLSSVLDQTYSDFVLYVADDGSSDNTNIIIDKFVETDKRIVKLNKKNVHDGACNSFMWLLGQIDADYYFFCDQDDVWISNKIERQISVAKQYDIQKPLLVHSDLKVVDETLFVLHESFWKFSRFEHSEFGSFNFHCAYNNIPGCSMLINKVARNISLNMPRTAKMHDAWISLAVTFHNGNIISIDEPLLYYRQHANNTIGAKESRTILQKIINIKSIIIENINLYRTINFLIRMNVSRFLWNKIRTYYSLLKR